MRLPTSLRPVVLPTVLLGVAAFCLQYVIVVSPSIRDILGLTESAFGWLLSSMFLSGIVGSLAAGWLADTDRTRAATVGSVALIAASFGLCALPPSYVRYLIGIALMGAGLHAITTVCNTVVVRACPGETRRALTVLQIGAAVMGMTADRSIRRGRPHIRTAILRKRT